MQQEPEPWLVLLKLIRVAKAAATVEAEAGATEALAPLLHAGTARKVCAFPFKLLFKGKRE